ncbi:MAG: hypothetical protein K1Y02_05105 [Candidatus Hydrogenedentes bacterium]|nr:hypothetical protein [Candidatus Hydrogenedentota bacterium]
MDVVLSMFGPTAHGESPAQTAANLKKVGATGLLFFTSLYHGYRLLQRRYPSKAIYSLETDRICFEPDLSFYADCSIRPGLSKDFAGRDWVAEMGKALHAEGLAFNPLIPVCAGERLVQEMPEIAVKNLYGSADRLFMCYNNPDVRAYRLAMVRDLASRYAFDNLMLDKIPQIMLEQCAFSGIFDAPLRTVGSACFCEHCKAAAAERNVDLEEIRLKAIEIANQSLSIPSHIMAAQGTKVMGDTEVPLLLLEEPLVYQLLQFRFETAVSFVGEIRRALKSCKPKAGLQAAFVPPSHFGHDMTSPRSWMTIQSYKKYADVLDEIYCIVHYEPDVVRFETQRAVAAAGGRTKIVTGMRFYGSTRPEEIAPLAEAALAGGSQGVHFLGYDITTDELLTALRAWVEEKGINR